ncbi:hypothetical protein B0H13DRAFT_2349475 [Mycena leptocephala]|nr:hypothetical protein B0H13DRAFT_2349475 [Mycena leptocephala]
MPDFFSIFMNDSIDTANMKGMLEMADLTPKRTGKRGPERLRGKFRGAHGVRGWGEPAVDYLHSTHHASCNGPGPRVSAITGRSTKAPFNIETCMECCALSLDFSCPQILKAKMFGPIRMKAVLVRNVKY